MAIIGYARVSTTDQDLSLQEEKLKASGATIIRSEKRSGATTAGRTELDLALEITRPGDTLLVTKIDRLAPLHRRLGAHRPDAGGEGRRTEGDRPAHRYRIGRRQGVPQHARGLR